MKSIWIGMAVMIEVYAVGGPVGAEAGKLAAGLYDVGSRTQLFIDEAFFEQSGDITLTVEPPVKSGQRILEPQEPWENASLNWFTVMADQGVVDREVRYRMWYEAYDVAGWPTANDTAFCYAESRDGVHWSRPELGLFTYEGSDRNNILFRMIGPPLAHSRVHGTGIFKDPLGPPHARYKGVGQGLFQREGRPHRIAGMVSPDGLKWTRLPKPICDIFADSQYSGFWDERIKAYVLFGRVAGRGGRAIGRIQSSRFDRFEPLKRVLQAEVDDPPESDLYNAAAMKYEHAANVYLMLPSLYQHRPDTLDIHLAVSRDGVHWSRPDRGRPFIALGEPGNFDSGSLYIGQGIIRSGDELWFYYSGSPLRHEEAELEGLTKPENVRVYSRVVARLDRLVAARAGSGGWFVTPPLRFEGRQLKLNLAVDGGGFVRVGLLDQDGQVIEGRSVANCVPLTGDQLDATVTWKGGSDLGTTNPVRIRVQMRKARIFAFRFSGT